MAYSSKLGRWARQDPAGYVDGLNAYEAVRSNPVNYVDLQGMAAVPTTGPTTSTTAPTTQPTLATPENVRLLARILKSEASVGNASERLAVAATVRNRLDRNKCQVRDVEGAYARNQEPTADETMYEDIATVALAEGFQDPTGGATHYYSPRSMPMEGDSTKGFDVGGGLENTPGLKRANYRPMWATKFAYCPVNGGRPAYFKFYKQPGTGKVR